MGLLRVDDHRPEAGAGQGSTKSPVSQFWFFSVSHFPLSWRVDQDVAHSPREAGAEGQGQVSVERV